MDPYKFELITVKVAGGCQLWVEGICRFFFGTDLDEWITAGPEAEVNCDADTGHTID